VLPVLVLARQVYKIQLIPGHVADEIQAQASSVKLPQPQEPEP
jgi:hypothetical protein